MQQVITIRMMTLKIVLEGEIKMRDIKQRTDGHIKKERLSNDTTEQIDK